MGRLSTTVAPAEAASAMHVQPTRSLYQNEAGVRRPCECVTAVLQNRQELKLSRNRRAIWGNYYNSSPPKHRLLHAVLILWNRDQDFPRSDWKKAVIEDTNLSIFENCSVLNKVFNVNNIAKYLWSFCKDCNLDQTVHELSKANGSALRAWQKKSHIII